VKGLPYWERGTCPRCDTTQLILRNGIGHDENRVSAHRCIEQGQLKLWRTK